METATATNSQIGLLSFQLAAATSNCGQMQQSGESGCGRFVAILQRMLQASGCQAGLDQADITQVVSGVFESIPVSTPPIDSFGDFLKGLKAGQGAEAEEKLVAAILQRIGQVGEGRIDQKEPNEGFLQLAGMISGRKADPESIPESDNSFSGTGKKDDTENSIDQAVILSLVGFLRQVEVTARANGAEVSAGEDPTRETANDQDKPDETTGAEIVCPWAAQTDSSPVLALPEGDNAEEETDSGNISKASLRAEGSPQPAVISASSPQLPIETAQSVTGTGLVPTEVGNDQTAKISEEFGKARGIGQERFIQAEGRHGRTANEAQNPEVYHAARDKNEGITPQSSSSPANTRHNPPDNLSSKAPIASEHTDTIYSGFSHGDGREDRQIVPNAEQPAPKESKVTVAKPVDKIDFLLSRVETELVKAETSSKSQSFAKGEGDSNQLGQSFASQRSAERMATSSTEASSSFGDIVADRIARTVEHIAETNRSDLTLRLKIDGSESVLLEMKERSGTILIGIRCQDKALGRALESQKEMIVKTLEAKNLNTSISIAAVGEDGQNRQRNGQREQHEQRRETWSGRQNNPRSYFETLV